MSCHIQLICQCSGLFLERPELAARNQAAINLRPPEQDAGEGCVKRGLMGKKAVPLPEQVTKQSGNSLLNLRLSGDYADLSRKHSEKTNKCDLETSSLQSHFFCMQVTPLQVEDKLISQRC